MKVAVVLMTCFVLSSAQQSDECERAKSSVTMNCQTAYFSLLSGNASDDQAMMVCNTTGACNDMLESVINTCDDSQAGDTTGKIPTRSNLDLLCAVGPNGTNCYAINNTAMEDMIGEAFSMIGTECQLTCRDNCTESFTFLNDTLGCCLAEIFQQQQTMNMAMGNINPEVCDLPPFQFCNGSALPRSSVCNTAANNLFGIDDKCSRAVQEYLNNYNNSVISDILVDNCPTRLCEYVNDCNQNNDRLSLCTLSQTTNDNGTRCSEFLPDILSGDSDDRENDEANCVTDFLMGQCSSTCKQTLMNVTAMYGCCFNTILAQQLGSSNDVNRQIEYAIITRDIYELCGVPSSGFCNGVTHSPYSDEAVLCTMAVKSFYEDDDTCTDYYRTLGERSSADAVNDAATAICTDWLCRNRMSSYTDYLIACRVGNNENSDDDGGNNSNVEEEDAGYLEFAYLTGNTTCRANSSNTSCYSSIYFNDVYGLVTEAIGNPDGLCASLMGETPQCTPNCTEFLREIRNNTGCCLGEYARALQGDTLIELVSTACDVPLDIRCTEITPAQSGNGGTDSDGASTQKGLGVLNILILVMITIQLF